MKAKEYIGKKYKTKEGYEITVIEYLNALNCTIQFEDGLILNNIFYSAIKKGTIKNPLHKSILSKGYFGIGKYQAYLDGKYTKVYKVWYSMLSRCYYEKHHIREPTYKDCTVSEEWLNFQVFAEWFDENYIEGYHLDKDLLIKNNKVYSSKTCVFIPQYINSLFTKSNSTRGEYPIGVTKVGKKFKASFSNGISKSFLGYYNTSEEAFQAYKSAKEHLIKKIAIIAYVRKQITKKSYEALINYKIEITD